MSKPNTDTKRDYLFLANSSGPGQGSNKTDVCRAILNYVCYHKMKKQLLELKKRLQYCQPSAPTFHPARATTHPMVLRGEGQVMHNHPQTLRREMIVKARSATSVENLVICSRIANSRTGYQRVTCHPDSLLTKELRLTWFVQTEDKLKHPNRKTSHILVRF